MAITIVNSTTPLFGDDHQHGVDAASSYGATQPPTPPSSPTSLHRRRVVCATMFMMLGYMFGYFASQLPVTKERLRVDDARFGLLLLADDVGSFAAQAFASIVPHILRIARLVPVAGIAVVVAAGVANVTRSAALFAAVLSIRGVASSLVDVALNYQFVRLGTLSGQVEAPLFHGLFSGAQMLGSGVGAALTRAQMPFKKQVYATAGVLAAGYALHWPLAGWQEDGDQDNNVAEEGEEASASPTEETEESEGRSRKTTVLLLAIVGLLSSIGEGGLPEWAGIYLRQDLHTDFATANAAAFACAAGMTLSRLFGSRAARYFGIKSVLIAGSTFTAAAMLAGLLHNRPTTFLVAVAASGAGLANITPLSIALLSQLPDGEQAAAVTRISIAQQIGFFSGPPLIGTASALLGLRLAIGLICATSAGVAALVVPLRLPSKRTGRRQHV